MRNPRVTAARSGFTLPGLALHMPRGVAPCPSIPWLCPAVASGRPGASGVQGFGAGLVTEPHTMLALGDLVLACAVRARRSPGPSPPAYAARLLQPCGWRVANSVPRSSTLAVRLVTRPLPDGLMGHSCQVRGRGLPRIRGKQRLSTHRYKPHQTGPWPSSNASPTTCFGWISPRGASPQAAGGGLDRLIGLKPKPAWMQSALRAEGLPVITICDKVCSHGAHGLSASLSCLAIRITPPDRRIAMGGRVA